ncbi:GlsB/YeaQ/YmgE family stress response membrane protein [Kineosporia rhizophila]|uniref:GlsB/YeaQ/YmgE family stress response membrane protein n=1 Tax=Kineosporia TaxID=49184 RepID=UPI000AF5F6AF|nr:MULTISPECIES: GlsB/YeaQ/YmgE family stress response membrane protein [Kineosporia]MCE0535374.1 GlsB/YeaQ/YmgE family stress response membrane protein [Kineosporia rhizophila]GLY16846.1 transglycosylase [Kineosporia sp. NBRC 101677]
MSFIWAIIAGLIVGAIARLVLPGRQNIPIWLTILLGIVGAVVGNAAAVALGVGETNGIDWIRHIIQVAVAAGLIVLAEPLYSRRSVRH